LDWYEGVRISVHTRFGIGDFLVPTLLALTAISSGTERSRGKEITTETMNVGSGVGVLRFGLVRRGQSLRAHALRYRRLPGTYVAGFDCDLLRHRTFAGQRNNDGDNECGLRRRGSAIWIGTKGSESPCTRASVSATSWYLRCWL